MSRLFLKKSTTIILLLYIITTFFVPKLIFNKLLFVMLLGILLVIIPDYVNSSKKKLINPVVCFLIFLVGYILSLFNVDCNRELSTQFTIGQLALFIIYPIVYFNINVDKIIKIVGFLFCIQIILFYIFFLVNPDLFLSNMDLFKLIGFSMAERQFVTENDLSFSFTGSYHMFLPFSIFFYSFLKDKANRWINGLMVISILFCVIITGARAQVILCLFIALATYIFDYKSKYRQLIIFGLLLILFLGVGFILTETNIFSLQEEGNNVKIARISAFGETMGFIDYLIGRGTASIFYISGQSTYTYHTEITLLDMIRWVGLFLAVLYYFLLLFPIGANIIKIIKNNIFPFIVIVSLCVYSQTNPVLLNSLGYIVVVWYWSKILQNENKCSNSNI